MLRRAHELDIVQVVAQAEFGPSKKKSFSNALGYTLVVLEVL